MERIKVIYGRNYLPFSILIRLFTWSRWSHCGVISPCGKYVFEAAAFRGVVKTPLNSFSERYRSLYIGEMLATSGWFERVQAELGKGYDWIAPLGIVFRMGNWNSKDKWFCSELVAHVSGLFRCDRGSRVTPEICYKVTKDEL